MKTEEEAAMQRPLIGIPTAPFRHSYADAALQEMNEEQLQYAWLLMRLTEKISQGVRRAGGIPFILTPAEDPREIKALVSRLDGLLFAGGSDIAPAFYGEENKGTISPWLERDHFELDLCREALERNRPMLGICRGCQLLNVALGGTLIQHLPDIKAEWSLHKRPDVMKGCVHNVKVTAPWLFPSLEGETMRVNSMHHQAIGRPARELQIAAQTDDGVIEAVWAPSRRYALGVQWHPECLAEEAPVQSGLFKELVLKAQEQPASHR